MLLEMVYFMWFELGQLERGAAMLTKVTFASHTNSDIVKMHASQGQVRVEQV